MVKNNIRALVYHIIIIMISTFMLTLFKKLSDTIDIKLNNILIKILISSIVFIIYYNFGKLMNLKANPKLDFATGGLIGAIGFVLFLLASIGHGGQVFTVPLSSSLWRMPFDIFMTPMHLVYTVLGIKMNLLFLVIALLFPTLVMGLGFRKRRIKFVRDKRRRKLRERKMRVNAKI